MLQDLERKAAELQRKEQELQRMQFGGRVFIFNLTFSQKRLVWFQEYGLPMMFSIGLQTLMSVIWMLGQCSSQIRFYCVAYFCDPKTVVAAWDVYRIFSWNPLKI